MATSTPSLNARLAAEALGTFWLVLGGVGTARFATNLGEGTGGQAGILAVALAFGFTVVTGALAFGYISGGHFNPAVSVGAALANRFDWKDVGPYAIAQLVGAILASGIIALVGLGNDLGADLSGAAIGFGEHSPSGFSVWSGLIVEIVATAVFVWIILGATDKRANGNLAPFAIGLALTVLLLVAIPVTNGSLNPARAAGVVFFSNIWSLEQLWLGLLAPFVGAAIAGVTYKFITAEPQGAAAVEPQGAVAVEPQSAVATETRAPQTAVSETTEVNN